MPAFATLLANLQATPGLEIKTDNTGECESHTVSCKPEDHVYIIYIICLFIGITDNQLLYNLL